MVPNSSAYNRIINAEIGDKMKLLFCPICGDVQAMTYITTRFCRCGKSWGKYTDYRVVTIGGSAIPLGIVNDELLRAVQQRPDTGLGEEFTAFVIPHECETVKQQRT